METLLAKFVSNHSTRQCTFLISCRAENAKIIIFTLFLENLPPSFSPPLNKKKQKKKQQKSVKRGLRGFDVAFQIPT